MAPPVKSKVGTSKEFFKELMKEKRKEISQEKKKIDSPLAKYNSLGKLCCIVCNIQIKSESLWIPHIASKSHKQQVSNLNATIKKRKREEEAGEGPPTKATKVNETAAPAQKIQPPSVSAIIQEYESSDEETEEVEAPSLAPKEKPLDIKPEASPSKENPKQVIPEGFFDDPKQDAQARGLEYKNPLEIEWEKFQKEMMEENKVSDGLMAEDVEENEVTETIRHIEDQMSDWANFQRLEMEWEKIRAERKEIITNTTNQEEPMEQGSSDNENEMEDTELEVLNWRSKGLK